MSPSIDDRSAIRLAQQMDGPPFSLPYHSFADFVVTRVTDPTLASQPFLTYYDDDRTIRRRYTYQEFGDQVARIAAVLREGFGVRRGDRIATVLFNHDDTVFIYFAAWTLGAAVVPINVEEPTDRKRYILEHSESAVVFCWADHVDEMESLQREIPSIRHLIMVGESHRRPAATRVLDDERRRARPLSVASLATAMAGNDSLDDEALIVYTSGTTGPPKGVVLGARHLLIDADGITAWHGFGRGDPLMCVLPIHHVNGTVVTLVTPFYAKGSVILNRKFKAGSFWPRIQEERVTCASVVPTLLEFLLETTDESSRDTAGRFRGVLCGAGPLLKETAARFEDRFRTPIHHGYGLSETTCYSSFLPNGCSTDQHRHWLTAYEFPSIGNPLTHNEMTILDPAGTAVGPRTRGEICIRGRTVCDGYFKRPDANEAAFRWGWFRSGDEGFYDQDEHGQRFFFISGRLKELIIRGGVNISPLEIDDVLRGHPAVKFAMAVPFDNRYYGEEIAAYVVPRNPAHPPSETDLLSFCRPHLPFARRPKVIVYGEAVPYTATGKPKRLELKATLAPVLLAYRDTQFKEHR